MNEESIGCNLFVQRAGILARLIKVWDMQGISFLERERVKHCMVSLNKSLSNLKGGTESGFKKGVGVLYRP